MRVRTDDEIYRIDAVWLGPPRATFPWRATYASYLLGFLIFIVVLFVQRRIGISFNIFPTAWALVITVFLTRVVSRKVNYEKGVVHLFEHFWYEVTGPRERTDRKRIALRDSRVRVRKEPATRSGRNRSAGRARSQAAARAAAGSAGRPAAGSAGRTTAGSTGQATAGSAGHATAGRGTAGSAGRTSAGAAGSAGPAGPDWAEQAMAGRAGSGSGRTSAPRKRPSRTPRPHPLRNGGR